MKLLSKQQILEIDDAVYETVDVPEWGGAVRIKGISGAERDAFEASMMTGQAAGKGIRQNLQNFRARLVALACVDEEGQRLFSDADVTALGKKSALALVRVFGVAQRLAGLGAEDVEAMTVNFTSGPNGDSTSV